MTKEQLIKEIQEAMDAEIDKINRMYKEDELTRDSHELAVRRFSTTLKDLFNDIPRTS